MSFLGEFVSDICAIQAWRSLWAFLDLYLFPEDRHKSAVVSLITGIVIYFIVYIFNTKMNKCLSDNNGQETNNEKLINIHEINASLKLVLFELSFYL